MRKAQPPRRHRHHPDRRPAGARPTEGLRDRRRNPSISEATGHLLAATRNGRRRLPMPGQPASSQLSHSMQKSNIRRR
jgi:hypothetical protein